MRLVLYLLFFSFVKLSFSQEVIIAKLLDSVSLNADIFIGVDNFEDHYYTNGNTLYKQTPNQTYSYTNTQLGNITSVDITNPLKILVFYRNFNTIVILDNRLNELSDRINLSDSNYGKNATYVTISSNNNLWLYSLDDNILTLWNYETKEIIFDSQPLQFYQDKFEAIAQTSTYENCWLISENGIIEFNEYGSFIEAKEIINISTLRPYKNGFIYLKRNNFYFNEDKTTIKLEGVNPKHLSTNYFVNKNTLSFFRSGRLYRYSILKN